MSDKVYLGREMAQLDISPALAPVSRVVLLVDDETAYTAGDDTGRTVEVVCPYGTQAMASNILAGLRAYTYTPLQAQDALLDPAAELGDGLTAGGVYTMLGRIDLEWDALMASDSGAPGKAEQENEYQYRSPVIAGLNYQIAQTRSQITKTAEEIRLEVSNEIEGLSASISVRLDSITSTIQDQAGQISQIQQTIDSITLSVSNGSTSSSITLSVGGVAVSSQTIQMNGLVTFTGLANGTTTINGGCIKTGLIDAERLNLTGAITFSDLSSSVRNDIDDALSAAQDAQSTVDRWSYNGTTYIDGTRIMTGTVSASTLEGGEINLLNGSGQTAGIIELTGASSYGGQKVVLRSGAIELNSQAGDVYIRSGSYGNYLQLSNGVFVGVGDLAPHSSGAQSCGTSARRWSDIYVSASAITTSDRNLKHDIRYDLSAYDALFDALKPCSFQYDNGRSGRTHLGLISQDVEEALEAAGLTSLDFAGFVKSPDEEAEGGYIYSLRYEEFVALCVREIQRLDQRVRELEL